MLLESLIDSDSEILINEHLYNPKTNSLSKEKISFVLMYIPKNESKEINLKESHTFVQEQLFHRPNLKLNIAENILKIAIGLTAIKCSRIGLGLMGMTSFYTSN